MTSTGRRKLLSSLFVAFCAGAVVVALIPLAFVLFFVISQGILSLNLAFFTHMPTPVGETMAVTMVIGNNPKVSMSLFAPQYTMAAVVANEFAEAAGELYLSALVEIGLVLFIITLIINSLSRLLIWSMARSETFTPEPVEAEAPA